MLYINLFEYMCHSIGLAIIKEKRKSQYAMVKPAYIEYSLYEILQDLDLCLVQRVFYS